MLKRNKSLSLLLVMLILVVASTMSAFQNQESSSPKPDKRIFEDDDYGPVAEYSASQRDVPEKRARRQKKDGRFRRENLEERPGSKELLITRGDWLERLPAFPVALSDTVVIGQIAEAEAYVSPGKTGIFSEFSILVEEVLKNTANTALSLGGVISAEREGGRVRYPSGHVQAYKFIYQGMPRQHRRYVLFLRRTEQSETPYIMTGYELRSGRVFPLDGMDNKEPLEQFAAYEGVAEDYFLKLVRDALSKGEGK